MPEKVMLEAFILQEFNTIELVNHKKKLAFHVSSKKVYDSLLYSEHELLKRAKQGGLGSFITDDVLSANLERWLRNWNNILCAIERECVKPKKALSFRVKAVADSDAKLITVHDLMGQVIKLLHDESASCCNFLINQVIERISRFLSVLNGVTFLKSRGSGAIEKVPMSLKEAQKSISRSSIPQSEECHVVTIKKGKQSLIGIAEKFHNPTNFLPAEKSKSFAERIRKIGALGQCSEASNSSVLPNVWSTLEGFSRGSIGQQISPLSGSELRNFIGKESERLANKAEEWKCKFHTQETRWKKEWNAQEKKWNNTLKRQEDKWRKVVDEQVKRLDDQEKTWNNEFALQEEEWRHELSLQDREWKEISKNIEKAHKKALSAKGKEHEKALKSQQKAHKKALSVKEKAHKKALSVKEKAHKKALSAKEEKYKKALSAKEEKYKKALSAKEKAHEKASEKNLKALSHKITKLQRDNQKIINISDKQKTKNKLMKQEVLSQKKALAEHTLSKSKNKCSIPREKELTPFMSRFPREMLQDIVDKLENILLEKGIQSLEAGYATKKSTLMSYLLSNHAVYFNGGEETSRGEASVVIAACLHWVKRHREANSLSISASPIEAKVRVLKTSHKRKPPPSNDSRKTKKIGSINPSKQSLNRNVIWTSNTSFRPETVTSSPESP